METSFFGSPAADTVLIQMVDDHDLSFLPQETDAIRQLSGRDFGLTAIRVEKWNADLSPWSAPAVFGTEAFGDGAARTLEAVLSHCGDSEKTYFIGGYSLAGLFALWAAHQTDVFRGVAAASPSVWFPGFTDYMRKNRIRCGRVYLSLGDREEMTRNPVMSTVGLRIREAYGCLREQGTDCTLEWNPGNHFRDAALRCAKAYAWVMRKTGQ